MSPESPRRLHRSGIAIYAVGALREAALPLLVLVVVSGLGGGLDERALVRGLAFAPAWWPPPCSATGAGRRRRGG